MAMIAQPTFQEVEELIMESVRTPLERLEVIQCVFGAESQNFDFGDLSTQVVKFRQKLDEFLLWSFYPQSAILTVLNKLSFVLTQKK